MRTFSVIAIIISTLLFSSCEALFPCLDGNGVITTENRAVTSFTSVNNTSDFDVIVQYSTDTYIEVKADENLQQYINTYVQGGDLILETEQGRCLQPTERILITVYCPYIESVVLSGSGDMDVNNFSADYFNTLLSGSGDINLGNLVVANSLEVTLSGSGDITADGKASEAHFYLSGSGDIHADMMKVGTSNVVLSGSGNVYTFVYNHLKILLSGSGNVYYYGDPADTENRITGSGHIIKK